MVGRKKEREVLLEAYKSDYSQFVAVYGRRRIGKTFLVRETFDYRFAFQHSGAANESMKGQLELFRFSLREYGHRDCPQLKSWHEAFEELKVVIQKSKSHKKTIFLDEVAWMDTPKSNFLSALEHFWNNWASNRKDVLLIICASATSWIIKKVFRNRGGLHNRISVKIPLAPFTLKECELFAKEKGLKLNRYQILNLYMVMGGVALYWSLLDKKLSAVQNVDQLFFNKDAKLQDEFNDLYDSLFKKPEPYKSIVVTLGKHLSGLTRHDLLKYTGQSDNGVFTGRLEELEECGFIMRMKSFPKNIKESVYKLCDNYTIFYFKYIKQNYGTEEFWTKNFKSPSARSWCGFAFERVCMQHSHQIKRAMGISAVASTEHLWRHVTEPGDMQSTGAQIDLLIDRDDNVISVCEMKWASEEFVIQKKDDLSIRNKIAAFARETGTKKAIHVTLVTTYGVKHNLYYDDIQSVVVLDQLFE